MYLGNNGVGITTYCPFIFLFHGPTETKHFHVINPLWRTCDLALCYFQLNKINIRWVFISLKSLLQSSLGMTSEWLIFLELICRKQWKKKAFVLNDYYSIIICLRVCPDINTYWKWAQGNGLGRDIIYYGPASLPFPHAPHFNPCWNCPYENGRGWDNV